MISSIGLFVAVMGLGAPELVEAFAAVRKAFALTKDRALAGLL